MPITFKCPQCEKPVRAPENLEGRKVKCPQCGSVVTVPAATGDPKPEGRSDAGTRGRPERSEPAGGVEDRPRPARRANEGISGAGRPTERTSSAGRGRPDREDDDDRPRQSFEPAGDEERQQPVERRGRSFNILGIISICLAIIAIPIAIAPLLGFVALPSCLSFASGALAFLSLPFSIIAVILGITGLIIAAANGRWGFITPTLGTVLSLGAIVLPFATCITTGVLGLNKVKQEFSEAQEKWKEAQEKMKEGDKLWDEGKKSEAVVFYKQHYGDINIWEPGDQEKKLKRIVDFEMEQWDKAEAKGNKAEAREHETAAREWIEKGVDQNKHPTYMSAKAKEIADDLWSKKMGVAGSSKGSSSGVAGQEVSMSVDAYVQALAAQKDQGDTQYQDKTIKLTGKVSWYGRYPKEHGIWPEQTYFLLEGTQERFICQDAKPSKALPGQEVVLRGKWTHGVFGVENWSFVSKKGAEPPKFNADLFAVELANKPDDIKKKWDGKVIQMSGEIRELPGGGVIVFTAPGKQPRLAAWFNADAVTLKDFGGAGAFKVGQKITIVGTYEAQGMQVGSFEIVKPE